MQLTAKEGKKGSFAHVYKEGNGFLEIEWIVRGIYFNWMYCFHFTFGQLLLLKTVL